MNADLEAKAAMNRDEFILMSVGGLTLDPVTKTPIVILKDRRTS